MTNMKKLSLAISLTIALAGTAFAGEMNSPPCPNPGEMNSPPCSSTPLVTDDPTDQSATIFSEVEMLSILTAASALEDLLTVY